MIRQSKTKVALEALDEIPYCRKVCNKWGGCEGKRVKECHLIQTILAIQEQKCNIVYTLGGQRVIKTK